MTTPSPPSKQAVNRRLRAAAGSFVSAEPIAFVCECDRPSCWEVVWLTGIDYDARTSWIIVEGHPPPPGLPDSVPQGDEPAVDKIRA
jgi:hypothetical protein